MDTIQDIIGYLNIPPFMRNKQQIQSIYQWIKHLDYFKQNYREGSSIIPQCSQLFTYKFLENKQVLFEQGQTSDSMYVVLQGHVGCYIPKNRLLYYNLVDNDYQSNNFIKVTDIKQGQQFGQLGVIFNHTRTASILAEEDTHLLVLNQRDFNKILMDFERPRAEKIIQQLIPHPFFKFARYADIQEVFQQSYIKNYSKNQILFKEQEQPDMVYIIRQGQLKQYKRFLNSHVNTGKKHPKNQKQQQYFFETSEKLPHNKEITIQILAEGSYFGDEDIILKQNRKYSVICYSEKAQVLMIPRQVFCTYLLTHKLSKNHLFTLVQYRTKALYEMIDVIKQQCKKQGFIIDSEDSLSEKFMDKNKHVFDIETQNLTSGLKENNTTINNNSNLNQNQGQQSKIYKSPRQEWIKKQGSKQMSPQSKTINTSHTNNQQNSLAIMYQNQNPKNKTPLLLNLSSINNKTHLHIPKSQQLLNTTSRDHISKYMSDNAEKLVHHQMIRNRLTSPKTELTDQLVQYYQKNQQKLINKKGSVGTLGGSNKNLDQSLGRSQTIFQQTLDQELQNSQLSQSRGKHFKKEGQNSLLNLNSSQGFSTKRSEALKKIGQIFQTGSQNNLQSNQENPIDASLEQSVFFKNNKKNNINNISKVSNFKENNSDLLNNKNINDSNQQNFMQNSKNNKNNNNDNIKIMNQSKSKYQQIKNVIQQTKEDDNESVMDYDMYQDIQSNYQSQNQTQNNVTQFSLKRIKTQKSQESQQQIGLQNIIMKGNQPTEKKIKRKQYIDLKTGKKSQSIDINKQNQQKSQQKTNEEDLQLLTHQQILERINSNNNNQWFSDNFQVINGQQQFQNKNGPNNFFNSSRLQYQFNLYNKDSKLYQQPLSKELQKKIISSNNSNKQILFQNNLK